jgi:heme-degrading monooxygenase HmoA
MVIVVFRSRLRRDADVDAYGVLSEAIDALAAEQVGFVSIDTYARSDGERVSVVQFDSDDAVAAWRRHPTHVEAQRRGREEFYEWYSIQTGDILRSSEWRRETH